MRQWDPPATSPDSGCLTGGREQRTGLGEGGRPADERREAFAWLPFHATILSAVGPKLAELVVTVSSELVAFVAAVTDAARAGCAALELDGRWHDGDRVERSAATASSLGGRPDVA